MEIENPKTGRFVPLLGASKFEYTPLGAQHSPDEFSFRIDWDKGGEGQEILREHIRSGSFLRVRERREEYKGAFLREWEFNTREGMVIVEVHSGPTN
ncbi:MAG TPA: hypothetical protein VGI45_26745 [Terracidiphilus sp.]